MQLRASVKVVPDAILTSQLTIMSAVVTGTTAS